MLICFVYGLFFENVACAHTHACRDLNKTFSYPSGSLQRTQWLLYHQMAVSYYSVNRSAKVSICLGDLEAWSTAASWAFDQQNLRFSGSTLHYHAVTWSFFLVMRCVWRNSNCCGQLFSFKLRFTTTKQEMLLNHHSSHHIWKAGRLTD